ncbi:MAG: YARHG domain-containing protein [Oscillospiraceae bacterium]|nr:YARHG domain-containing protein [Oscillospiraceae bacterium]
MKRRWLALLLCALLALALAGCGASAHAAPAETAASNIQDNSPRQENAPAPPGEEVPTQEAGAMDNAGQAGASVPEFDTWRDAYNAVMKELILREDLYMQPGEGLPISGVCYGQLADFDFDGTPELVVCYNRHVELYTFDAGTARLLWDGDVGPQYGQTDVGAYFALNTVDPCLVVFDSANEWTQEAMTVVSCTGDGVTTTELLAETDGKNDAPTREALTAFRIDGRSVTAAEYAAVRDSALDSAQFSDADWGGLPGTVTWLSALRAYLSGSEEFVCPTSGFAYLTERDLAGMDAETLWVARNELYARHGLAFRSEDLQAHFGACSWYTPLDSWEVFELSEGNLFNAYESYNLALIQRMEAQAAQNAVEGARTEDVSDDAQDNADTAIGASGEALTGAAWARARAMEYWGITEGAKDSETGFQLDVFCTPDADTEHNGRSYYTAWVRWLVDGDHWSTLDQVYVDAESGECVYQLN